MANSEPSLRLYLFGELRAEHGGEPFRVAAPERAIKLLIFLLLHRDAPIPRDKAAFLIWPDDSEDEARGKLRRNLYRVTNALPPRADGRQWIAAGDETLQWNRGPDVWLDVDEFERTIGSEEGRAAAVELYEGDVAESIYDDWIFADRDRLRSSYLSGLYALIADYRSKRDYGRAVATAQRMLAADEWREDAVRSLMAARYESGDRSGAINAFEEFVRRLRAEMSVDPMPETQALYEAILRNEPVSPGWSASEREPEARSAAAPALPLVGRDAEIEQLRAAWSRAAHGRGGFAIVSGEAGIGKSRLAYELSLIVQSEGGRVLFGSTSSPEAVPYESLAGSLRSALPMLAALDISAQLLSALALIVPDLRARRPDLPASARLDAEHERLRMFEAIAAGIEGLSRQRPVLAILEDLQWAGSTTVDAIEFLARRCATRGILVLGTYRTEDSAPDSPIRNLRGKMQREGALRHHELARLTVDDVRRATSGIDVGVGNGVELAARLHRASEGNPLFLTAAVQEIAASGADAPEFTGSARLVITRLIDGLKPDAQALAQAAAVVGRGFDVDVVRAVTGWGEATINDGLGALLDRGIVRESIPANDYDFVFAHHLIRDALYDRNDESTLRRRHHRVAQVMIAALGVRAEGSSAEIAFHLDRAHDESAAQWYLRAAKHALSVFAADEALAHADRGLALSHDAALDFELTCIRDDVLNARGDRVEQRRAVEHLDSLSQQIGSLSTSFEALLRRGRLERAVDDHAAENDIAERLEALATTSGDPASNARALHFKAELLIHRGDFSNARSSLDRACVLFERAGDRAGECACVCELVNVASHQSSHEELPGLLARARSLAAGTSQREVMRATASAATAAFAQKRFEQCLTLNRERLELAVRLGDALEEAESHRGIAASLVCLVRHDEAAENRRLAIASYERVGSRQGIASVHLDEGVVCIEHGRLRDARAAMDEARREFESLGAARGHMTSIVNLSAIDILLGDFAQAKVESEQALAFARQINARFVEALALQNEAIASLRLGRIDVALERAKECLALARRLELDGEIAGALEVLALVLLHAGRLDEAQVAADDCVKTVRTLETGVRNRESAFWAAAQVYRARRKAKKSAELLAEARQTLEDTLAGIPDELSRQAYRRTMPWAVEIDAAVNEGIWPPLRRHGDGDRVQ